MLLESDVQKSYVVGGHGNDIVEVPEPRDDVLEVSEIWKDDVHLRQSDTTLTGLLLTSGGGHNGSFSSFCRLGDSIVTVTSWLMWIGCPLALCCVRKIQGPHEHVL